MQKNKIALWVPAKRSQGMGHFYRNRWIAEKLEQVSYFFNEELEYSFSDSRESFISNNPKDIEDYLISKNYKTVFVDHYFLSAEIISYLLNQRRIRIVWFDNNFSAPAFDALVNSNPFANEELYKKPEKTRLFLGASYFGFRKDFYDALACRKMDSSILISFGGSDVSKLTLGILEALSLDFTYNICLGKGCSRDYSKQVQEKFEQLKLKGKVYFDPENYLDLMASSSAAILTSSTSVYEAEFFDVPYVAFNVVDNQERLASYLGKNGITILSSLSDFKMTEAKFRKLGLRFGSHCDQFLSYLEL